MTSSNLQETAGAKNNLPPLYKWHLRGAIVRSLASFIMWLCCLAAYGLDLIRMHNLIGDTLAVSYLIGMNPPALWVLKRIRRGKFSELFGIFINFLEIIGYTAVIYSFGGIEATYLLPIYAALITYVGIMGPQKLPFIIAGLCSLCFGTLLTLEHVGVLPPLQITPGYRVPWSGQLAILAVETVLLLIVAFISSHTAQLLKRNRDKLFRQNQDLQLAAIKARQSETLKSEFLANISHELRTPLNAIIGFSELLQDENLGALNARQRESLGDIHTSGKHLLAIINDLIELSKVEAGRLELRLAETDLKALLQRTLDMFREKILDRGLKLSADMDDCPEVIRADERKLIQILCNLLSNAVKFTPAGGEIRLSVRELIRGEDGRWMTNRGKTVIGPVSADPEGMAPRRLVEICVADTGIGLKAEDMERIFNPFEQVDGSLGRRYQGTGLGLSLAKRLVELHHGKIWAKSEGEHRGSAFHLLIPA